MSTPVLYNYDLDQNCYKVRLALSLLGVGHEVVAVDAFPGKEHTTPPFLAMNPLGALPILKAGDDTLFGAEAILAWLARTYAPSVPWLPVEPAAFGKTMQWLVFSAGELAATVSARSLALFDTAGDEAALRAQARKALRIMDDHMVAQGFRGEDFFAGPAATVADIALFPAFALSRDYGVDHDEYPALRRWERRFRTLPGFLTMPGIPDYH